MTERKLVPHIRFMNFYSEWNTVKLSRLLNVYDGVHQTPTYTKSGVPFVSVENIRNLKTNKYISKNDFDLQFKSSKPACGDLLMTRIGDIGTVNIIKSDGDLAYYVSLALLKPKAKSCKNVRNSYYLMYLVESPRVKKELWKRTLHIAFPKKINKNEISKITICTSSDIGEQQKIGGLFAKLDRLLDLQQQKLDQLELLKKALLQKLFPKQDAKIPELRFKGFEEEWKTDKLGKVTKYVKGFAFKSKDYTNTGIRIVRVTDLTDNKIDELKKDSTFVSLKTAESYQKYRLYKGDIIITTVGSKTELKSSSVGRAIFVSKSVNYLLNQNLVKLSTINKFNSPFVYFLLCKPNYSNYISRIERGNANQANIAIDDLWKYKFKIPQFSEQQKIGNLLAKIDRLIELENKKFSNLKLVKKSLLQNMFVE